MYNWYFALDFFNFVNVSLPVEVILPLVNG